MDTSRVMIFSYICFLRMLFAQASSRPVILVEFPFISRCFCLQAGEVYDAAHPVAEFVAQHGWTQACIVGHSYGTRWVRDAFVASWICQMHPKLVQSLVSSSLGSCLHDIKWCSGWTSAACHTFLEERCYVRCLLI